jgi:hypothetical protein
MGGFGSGGRRVGAGRKSKTKSERKAHGSRNRTKASDAGKRQNHAKALKMPAGMTPGQQLAWKEMAPFAEKAGTLVEATVMAFRDLCEVVAMRRSILAQLELDGLMVNQVKVDEETGDRFTIGLAQAHPLLSHERQYRLREEAGKARFMVLPTGKPMASDDKPEDPFAEFDGLKVVKGGRK